jgi:hypothetical protein
MRGDEQADSARVKTVKASLLTQCTRCQTLKRCSFMPLPQRSLFGPGWVGLYAISVDYSYT